MSSEGSGACGVWTVDRADSDTVSRAPAGRGVLMTFPGLLVRTLLGCAVVIHHLDVDLSVFLN